MGGLIGWSATPPPAYPAALRELLAELGVHAGASEADLAAAVRGFQQRAGLRADGQAGPRTVHLLVRYATEAREVRRFSSAA